MTQVANVRDLYGRRVQVTHVTKQHGLYEVGSKGIVLVPASCAKRLLRVGVTAAILEELGLVLVRFDEVTAGPNDPSGAWVVPMEELEVLRSSIVVC